MKQHVEVAVVATKMKRMMRTEKMGTTVVKGDTMMLKMVMMVG